jgi:carbon-monoxide dehydrogenase medium subunit
LRDFVFLEPTSAAEAGRMLIDSGEGSRLYAGGTALMLAMRQRVISPSHIVFLGGVPSLRGIELQKDGSLRIGALVTHSELAASAVVATRYPMLAAMARRVANPQIRNQGTLGGNLSYADPASDPPGCLIALGASVRVAGRDGLRDIPLDEFYTDYYETALQVGDVVTEIHVPPMAADERGAYTRLLRTSADHRPIVNVAVVVRRQGKLCHAARIVVGASVAVPTRLTAVEQFLQGKRISEELLAETAVLIDESVQPISDFRGSAEYRREVIRAGVRRAIAAAFE